MPKKTTPRKPGRPALGGVLVKTRLPLDVKARLDARAAEQVRSASDLIRDAVVAALAA